MQTTLLIPIHLDALYLRHDQSFVETAVHFNRLPYTDSQQDYNTATPYLSEEIVSTPLQNKNLQLRAGLHLHWALPDALTRGEHTRAGTTFPRVPNRWLIVRSRIDGAGQRTVDSEWVVESDYLFPEGISDMAGVTVPQQPQPQQEQYQPFRFLGRAVPLANWLAQDPAATYLDTLTAVGYGEPTFAAFYPNAHTTFGFYDRDIFHEEVLIGLQYDLIGWYSQAEQDYWRTTLNHWRQHGLTDTNLLTAIQNATNWTFTLGTEQEIPEQMLCYARIRFNPNTNTLENPVLQTPQTTIAVGNTGLEALAAHLGESIDVTQKAIIEEQLEALTFSNRLAYRQLDIGPKFREARHEAGFVAASAGSLWRLRLESREAQVANAEHTQMQTELEIPPHLATLLDQLNQLQTSYNANWLMIDTKREQLFSDWYKYMLSAYPPADGQDDYPDADQLRSYLETAVISPLQSLINETGLLLLTGNETTGRINGATTETAATNTIAAQLATLINNTLTDLTNLNNSADVQAANAYYSLRQIAAPRYWQPTEPVLLLTGSAVQPTPRHGQDGRLRPDGFLQAHLLTTTISPHLIPTNSEQLLSHLDTIEADEDTQIGFHNWQTQPWHPFMLEWEVELFPLAHHGNHNGDYGTDFITSNYTLAENAVELTIRPEQGETRQGANIYRGRSLLTSDAGPRLQEAIANYLTRQLLPDYYQSQNIPIAAQSETYFQENSEAILAWHQTLPTPDPLMQTIIAAYQHLTQPTFHHLAQALSGFNDALLMHKQTYQLNIADPLRFDDEQPFVQAIRETIQNGRLRAPQPLNDFNPIRSGGFRIQKLRLIDTFGQTLDLPITTVTAAESLTNTADESMIALPPRLVQPVRLNFRWLAAADEAKESNNQPQMHPICGWLLPNNLDSTLAVYDETGMALGDVTLNPDHPWQPALHDEAPNQITEITNPHLRQMVTFIAAQGATYLDDFISVVDNALATIDPESFAQHQALALLMARPLAVVRATLNLELLGEPAIHQGWHTLRQALTGQPPETDNIAAVKFPIRLGEYQQLNDGLVGYWVEQGAGYHDDLFYAPQAAISTNTLIRTHHDGTLQLEHTIDNPPQQLTMLLDPRGQVHATTGILPTKAIHIPPPQYAAALQAIEINFLTTPILTANGRIQLPLPTEPGFEWQWLTRTDTTPRQPEPPLANTAFATTQEIREGWLRLSRQRVNNE